MNKRLPLWLRHVLYNLRGGFLVRPLAIALALGCTGALVSWTEEKVPGTADWVPRALFPSHADPQVAQVILGGIAASIMTVVSIVFAIMLMSLTLASMQFSPRIIVSFVRDGVTQWTLGIFLGTFSYCMAALPAAHSLPHPVAPVAAVCGAMLLALVCVGWLLFFIHHIAHAISVSHIVDRIAFETENMIDEMMPSPFRKIRLETPGVFEAVTWDRPLSSVKSGYIRFVDIPLLVALAKASRVKVRVVRRVGQFIPAGTPLLMFSKGFGPGTDLRAEFLDAFDLGPSRTLQQDIEFGILQIVDIALKAISPAVNDPSTAIACVDQLSRILIRFASKEPAPDFFYDPPGILRVNIRHSDFPHLLNSAFEQIGMYAKGDTAVSLRLLRGLGDLASTTRDNAFHEAIRARGNQIVAGCSERLSEEELRAIRVRMTIIETLTERTSEGIGS